MILAATTIEWGALAGAGVTLLLGILTFFRQSKDSTARKLAEKANQDVAGQQLVIDGALALAKEASEEASTARERAGMAEARATECTKGLRECEARSALLEARVEQMAGEIEGLASALDNVRARWIDEAPGHA